jgi:hypothetical protein
MCKPSAVCLLALAAALLADSQLSVAALWHMSSCLAWQGDTALLAKAYDGKALLGQHFNYMWCASVQLLQHWLCSSADVLGDSS